MCEPEKSVPETLPPEYWMPAISNVASATECTGLMYNPPQDEAEEESYRELSTMEIPRLNPREVPERKTRRHRADSPGE